MEDDLRNSHQFGPAVDSDFQVQRCAEEDEEEECEEEGRAAHKLKEVKSAAGSAGVHHLLQHERHEGQELEEKLQETKNIMRNYSQCRKTPGFN